MFVGVSHPLEYTADGGARDEEPAAFARRMDSMRACGIQRILCDIPFPFEGAEGTASAAFTGFARLVARWRSAGFDVLGVTPYPAGFEGGWKIDAGAPGSARFLRTYERACSFLARELADGVGTWLIANQLNLERFRRPLTEDDAVRFAIRGACGVRAGNPSARIGVNMFGFDATALGMYARLYPNAEVAFDYAGANGFFGTFDPGGPDEWYAKLALLRGVTRAPVVVLECGFPSAGEVMAPAERAGALTHHQLRKLPHVWGAGHTPETQARYLERVFWVFAHVPDFLGAFWFAWTDRPKCWNCGQPDCPAGTANGLVTLAGDPKPSYHAFARAARGEFDLAAIYPDEPELAAGAATRLGRRLADELARGQELSGEAEYLRRALDVARARRDRTRRALGARAAGWLLGRLHRNPRGDDQM